jgi:hypothetical protein
MEQTIAVDLPDISGSLRTLHAQLQGAEEKAE